MGFVPAGSFPPLAAMSVQYRQAEKSLRAALRGLRKQLRETDDPEEQQRIKAKIWILEPVLTENRKIAEMLERYYDPTYSADPQYSLKSARNGVNIRDTNKWRDESCQGPELR